MQNRLTKTDLSDIMTLWETSLRRSSARVNTLKKTQWKIKCEGQHFKENPMEELASMSDRIEALFFEKKRRTKY